MAGFGEAVPCNPAPARLAPRWGAGVRRAPSTVDRLTDLHWAGELILMPDPLHALPRLSDLPLLFPLLTLLFPRTLAYLPSKMNAGGCCRVDDVEG